MNTTTLISIFACTVLTPVLKCHVLFIRNRTNFIYSNTNVCIKLAKVSNHYPWFYPLMIQLWRAICVPFLQQVGRLLWQDNNVSKWRTIFRRFQLCIVYWGNSFDQLHIIVLCFFPRKPRQQRYTCSGHQSRSWRCRLSVCLSFVSVNSDNKHLFSDDAVYQNEIYITICA